MTSTQEQIGIHNDAARKSWSKYKTISILVLNKGMSGFTSYTLLILTYKFPELQIESLYLYSCITSTLLFFL